MKKDKKSVAQPGDEISKLLFLILKNNSGLNQASLILELKSVGFENKRIAELLNTTPNTVNVTAQKAKNRKKK